MDQNYSVPIVVDQNQQIYSRSSQNLGLPANSRLIHEPLTYNPPNNYYISGSSQAQQYYAPVSQASNLAIPSTVYQASAEPRITYSSVAPSAGIAYQEGGQINSFVPRSSQRVMRSRLVPVTQYVPVYEYEQAPPTHFQNTTVLQRTILHEPENFKERINYQEKIQAYPTMMEEVREVEAPVQAPSPRVVKVSQDPLVETVPGSWKSRVDVGASRTTYVPPPLPREEKPCCSGWLLLLLGLLALGGLLTAILLAKNSSSSQPTTSASQTVSGTKVSSAGPAKVSTVAPLTDAKITEVRGTTAVTAPTPISFVPQPTVVPLQAVIPTDISKVASTAPSSFPSSSVEPEKIGFVPVNPVVVPYYPVPANTQPSVAAVPTFTDSAQILQPAESLKNLKVSSAIPYTTASISNQATDEIKVGSIQPIPVEASTIQPTVIQPSFVQSGLVQPTVIQPSTIQPTLVQSGIVQPTVIQPSTIQPSFVQSGIVQPTVIQPSFVQSGIVQPTVIQPSTVQSSTVEPTVIQPSSIIQPTLVQSGIVQPASIQPGTIQPSTIQPSAVQPGRIEPIPFDAITISKVNGTTSPSVLASNSVNETALNATIQARYGDFLPVAEVKDE